MIAILMIALGVGTAHATHYPNQYYSCPPDDYGVYQFRQMTGDLRPQAIPSVDMAVRELQRASPEIRKLVNDSVKEALSYKADFAEVIRPFVHRCCDKPEYKCSSVRIPLYFIWYHYRFCFIVYPFGEKTIYYSKCTCCTCVRQDYCPSIGRCVETNYTYHYIVVYCPYYGFKILLIVVPKDCQCHTDCPPYSHYNNYKSTPQLSIAGKASASAEALAEAPAGAEDDPQPEEP